MSALSEALRLWIRAVQDLEEAKASCEYDHSYFCHREIKAAGEAEGWFLDELRHALESREATR